MAFLFEMGLDDAVGILLTGRAYGVAGKVRSRLPLSADTAATCADERTDGWMICDIVDIAVDL